MAASYLQEADREIARLENEIASLPRRVAEIRTHEKNRALRLLQPDPVLRPGA